MSHRAEVNKDISKIIKYITLTSMSELAIFVEGDFSRRQLEILHSRNKNI